ncbi:MAG: amidohydrolase family protein, partial [Gemmatimonadetes bacterium]|nr:amidohydrolase family protein [Gemmatimonadota bacterium]
MRASPRPVMRHVALAVLVAMGTASAQPPVAITGGTVIDGTGRAPQPRSTVVVQDGRIVAVGRDGTVRIPARAERIAARGKYLVAGLWDTHVHLGTLGRDGLPSLVRHGITSVRDLGGELAAVRSWRDAAERGEWLGPRIRLSGPIVENAFWLKRVRSLGIPGLARGLEERIPVETEADAVKAVDSIAAMGVEVLKLRNAPGTAAYTALLAAARRKGLRVAGHQPNRAIGLAGTLAAGQRSIEHMEGLGEMGTLAPALRDSLARAYAAADVWITPTLAASFGRFVPDSVTEARVAGTSKDPDLSLVTEALRDFWKAQRELKAYDSPLDQYARMVSEGLAGLRTLRAAGVKLMAGTDLGVLTLTPGRSLHLELTFLVD